MRQRPLGGIHASKQQIMTVMAFEGLGAESTANNSSWQATCDMLQQSEQGIVCHMDDVCGMSDHNCASAAR